MREPELLSVRVASRACEHSPWTGTRCRIEPCWNRRHSNTDTDPYPKAKQPRPHRRTPGPLVRPDIHKPPGRMTAARRRTRMRHQTRGLSFALTDVVGDSTP